jgi:mevalonate pyrophosphate decarboxylase
VKKIAEWAVLYQGAVSEVNEDGDEVSRWVNGITEAGMFLDKAQALADKMNNTDSNFQFWVVHESSNSYQQHL